MIDNLASWLLIRYRTSEGTCPAVGVALYVPQTNELFIEFTEDVKVKDPEELELLAQSCDTILSMAVELGSKQTFDWMAQTLSNAIFVEGTYEVATDNPGHTASQLYSQYCALTPLLCESSLRRNESG